MKERYRPNSCALEIVPRPGDRETRVRFVPSGLSIRNRGKFGE